MQNSVRAASWLRRLAVGGALATALAGLFLPDWPALRFVVFYLAPLIFAGFFWSSFRVSAGWDSHQPPSFT